MATQVAGGDDGGMAALLNHGSAAGQGSARLLERFAGSRDEAAFAALVARHGPMVRATCRRLLPDPADADDAFQATFLVLARRAGAIRDGDRLAPWLHGVARRVAARSRRGNARRRRREVSNREPGEAAVPLADPPGDGFELRSILDEELARLPGKYRDPLILCYLDGLTSDEAARRLAWPVGTVRTRLAGARDRLRSRLARRGVAPGALALLSPATLPTAAVSPTLQAESVRLALGSLVAGAPGAPAAMLLARGVLASMLTTKLQTAALVVAATASLAVGSAGLIAAQGPAPGGKVAQPVPAAGSPSPDPEPGPTPASFGVLFAELEAARQKIKALEVELAASRPTTGPIAASESIVPYFPPLAAGAGSEPRPVHPPGPSVTAEQAQAAYFNAWSIPLGDGWRLDSPAERDQVTISKPGSGLPETFQAPGEITTVVPVVNGDRVGLHLVGPKIGVVVAYSPADHRWSRQALREGPVDGRIKPTILPDMIEYTVGRFVYAYSPRANRWGVLELAAVPAGVVPPGSNFGPPGMTIPEGDVRHVFDAATGEWTHRDKDGKSIPVGEARPAQTELPAVPAAPVSPTPLAPAAPLAPALPISTVPVAAAPVAARPAPSPRRATLQTLPDEVLMSISAEGDRVVMIDPKAERRATLRLGSSATRITAVPLYLISDSPKMRNATERLYVVGLALQGPAIARVAVFDPKGFEWHQQDLARPVTSVDPRLSAGSENPWVTFELTGPGVGDAPAFNMKTREWDANKLDLPPQPSSLATVLSNGLKITRSGTFYHFQRPSGGAAISFGVKDPATPIDQASRANLGRIVTIDQLGITLARGTFCVQDGDTLNVVDPKAMTLRRINLTEDGGEK